MNDFSNIAPNIYAGNIKALARAISLVENEVEGYADFLKSLPPSNTPVVGITGPPGAGKSTLTDALIGELVQAGKRVAVLCIDPSSPFSLGALLGDRIRMNQWYNHPNVFIRSLATRGSLGGLHPKIIEITDILKAAPFDYVIVETVGVGQSEVEIAGLADTTVVVLVPEAGDEVQTMKAGLMEVADIFVVNKADREGADTFARNLRHMIGSAHSNGWQIQVMKTTASQNLGVHELLMKIDEHHAQACATERKLWLLAEKAYQLIQQRRMSNIKKEKLREEIKQTSNLNLYRFVDRFFEDK